MKPAKRSDWKIEPIPEKHSIVEVDRWFSNEQIERLKYGIIPSQMEERWFVYWENDVLHFHRSWTGINFYSVLFEQEGEGMKMVRVRVNREHEDAVEEDDEVGTTISRMIDVLFFRHTANRIFKARKQDE